MRKVQYKAHNGNMQWKPSFKWIEAVQRRDEYKGFCLACGATQDDVEPDARQYVCESCGAHKVFGAEELGLMGLYCK